jgi:hypothetical protein
MKRTADAFLSWRIENGACNFEDTFPTFGVYILTLSDVARSGTVLFIQQKVLYRCFVRPVSVTADTPYRLEDWPSSATNRIAFELVCWFCFSWHTNKNNDQAAQ